MCFHALKPPFLSFHWLCCGQAILFLAEGAPQLGERNVLQLANTLARDAEIPTDVFQGLWLSTVETETLRDNFLLAFVEHIEHPVHFMEQVFVAQQFERSLRLLVVNYLAKLR